MHYYICCNPGFLILYVVIVELFNWWSILFEAQLKLSRQCLQIYHVKGLLFLTILNGFCGKCLFIINVLSIRVKIAMTFLLCTKLLNEVGFPR